MKSCVTTCIRSPIHYGRFNETVIISKKWLDEPASLWNGVAGVGIWKRKSAYLCDYHIPILLLGKTWMKN